MKKHTIANFTVVGALLLGLTACSSTRHSGSAGDAGADAMGADGANATGAETTDAYAEGTGESGNGGFKPGTSCNVPQTAGAKTQSFYFEYDKSDVHPEDNSRLKSLGSNLHNKVRVVGNTDNRGSREYNIALGWRRANAVSSALQQSGVSKQHIVTTSNGAEKPIALGSSDSDYQCNRRVDVTAKN